MKNNSQDTSNLENQIDQLVYRLYDLAPEENKVWWRDKNENFQSFFL